MGTGKAAPKLVQQKQVWVQSPSPMDSDDLNSDPAAGDVSLGHHPDETDWSQPIYMSCHRDGGRSQGDTRHSMPLVRRQGSFNFNE